MVAEENPHVKQSALLRLLLPMCVGTGRCISEYYGAVDRESFRRDRYIVDSRDPLEQLLCKYGVNSGLRPDNLFPK